jgi:hypothetical protein
MNTRFALVGCVLFAAAASGGEAADLGYGAVQAPYGSVVEVVSPYLVVPACTESHRAVLMRCLPRREIAWPDDVGLIRIGRSLARPAPRPYRQLFTWP